MVPPEVMERKSTSTALWPRFNTPPREYSWKGAVLWPFFHSSEELRIKRFEGQVLYGILPSNEHLLFLGNGQGQIKKVKAHYYDPAKKKTPHRENTREKVPHIDPLNRGSEELRKNGTRDKYKAGY